MITNMIVKFKEKLKKSPVIGLFSKTIDPSFIECIGFSGFDFVIIDIEHGPVSLENAQNLVRAAQISNVLPIIRVRENSFNLISAYLDIGAGGIQVPHVKKAKDIKKILEYAKFFPRGKRGICKFVRAADYSSVPKESFFEKSNEIIIAIQLEGKEAIANLDEILNVEGYDILFIGPYDLSQSLGIPGQVDHPLVEDKILEIIEKCKKKKIIVGIFTDKIEDTLKWFKLGVKYLSYSVDVGIFYESCKTILKKIMSSIEI